MWSARGDVKRLTRERNVDEIVSRAAVGGKAAGLLSGAPTKATEMLECSDHRLDSVYVIL